MPERPNHVSVGILEELDRERGIEHAIAVAPAGVNFLILPYLGPYEWFLDRLDRSAYSNAERSPSRSLIAATRAATLGKVAVAVSYYEVAAEGVFYATTSIVNGEGLVVGNYRQAHALNRRGWHEQLYFSLGAAGQVPVFEIDQLRVGLLLGSDLWIPEAPRLLAISGADVLIAQAGISEDSRAHAMNLSVARAIENGRAVILANRGGGSFAFAGSGCDIPISRHKDNWSTVSIDLTEQRKRLLVDDPLRMRQPRFYQNLAHGEEGALP